MLSSAEAAAAAAAASAGGGMGPSQDIQCSVLPAPTLTLAAKSAADSQCWAATEEQQEDETVDPDTCRASSPPCCSSNSSLAHCTACIDAQDHQQDVISDCTAASDTGEHETVNCLLTRSCMGCSGSRSADHPHFYDSQTLEYQFVRRFRLGDGTSRTHFSRSVSMGQLQGSDRCYADDSTDTSDEDYDTGNKTEDEFTVNVDAILERETQTAETDSTDSDDNTIQGPLRRFSLSSEDCNGTYKSFSSVASCPEEDEGADSDSTLKSFITDSNSTWKSDTPSESDTTAWLSDTASSQSLSSCSSYATGVSYFSDDSCDSLGFETNSLSSYHSDLTASSYYSDKSNKSRASTSSHSSLDASSLHSNRSGSSCDSFHGDHECHQCLGSDGYSASFSSDSGKSSSSSCSNTSFHRYNVIHSDSAKSLLSKGGRFSDSSLSNRSYNSDSYHSNKSTRSNHDSSCHSDSNESGRGRHGDYHSNHKRHRHRRRRSKSSGSSGSRRSYSAHGNRQVELHIKEAWRSCEDLICALKDSGCAGEEAIHVCRVVRTDASKVNRFTPSSCRNHSAGKGRERSLHRHLLLSKAKLAKPLKLITSPYTVVFTKCPSDDLDLEEEDPRSSVEVSHPPESSVSNTDDADSGYHTGESTLRDHTPGELTLTREELRKNIDAFNDNQHGLIMTLHDETATFQGFIRVHMNLMRPISMSLPSRPTSIYDVVGSDCDSDEPPCETLTTSFYLPKDTTKVIHISSATTTQDVIKALLQKFKITDNPRKFALYEKIEKDGAKATMRRLVEEEKPLPLCLSWTAEGLESHKYVLQENEPGEIVWEAFSIPELENFLKILDREEDEYVDQLKAKYKLLRIQIERQMKTLITEGEETQSASCTAGPPGGSHTSFEGDNREPVYV